jgi:hypothetical protein
MTATKRQQKRDDRHYGEIYNTSMIGKMATNMAMGLRGNTDEVALC